jgi:hydroxyacylglutathione hydrolase
MLFRRFYDDQLAQASYLIGCQATGEALVVDPNRHLEPYLRGAESEGLRISHVTETHIHADVVAGARELAHRAGAKLLLADEGGDDWRHRYAAEAGAELLRDGRTFCVGRVAIRVMHTPGHTPEHLTFLVTDGASATEPMGALTGDFVFVGDVGRPDLLERAAHMAGSMETSARQLFRSLQRLGPLPDYLQIWPGHGAGSACGKALGAVPQSTLGYERRFNWAFGIRDEDEFVRAVLAGQPDPPRYFAEMKRINRDGPRIRGDAARPPALDVAGVARAIADGVPVVDTRAARVYADRAIPGTLNIPANRSFATYAGSLLPYDRDFYLIADDRGNGVAELLRTLAGIGLDRVAGFAGIDVLDQWQAAGRPVAATSRLDLRQTAEAVAAGRGAVLDVRSQAEWAAGHLPGAVNVPLGELEQRIEAVPPSRPLIVQCQTGARAAIAVSLLKARGLEDVFLYPGGFAEWSASGQAVEAEERR